MASVPGDIDTLHHVELGQAEQVHGRNSQHCRVAHIMQEVRGGDAGTGRKHLAAVCLGPLCQSSPMFHTSCRIIIQS